VRRGRAAQRGNDDAAREELRFLTRGGREDSLALALTASVHELLSAHCTATAALPVMRARGIVSAVADAARPTLEDLLRGVLLRVARTVCTRGVVFSSYSAFDADLVVRDAFRAALVEDCTRVTSIAYLDAAGAVVGSTNVSPAARSLGAMLVTESEAAVSAPVLSAAPGNRAHLAEAAPMTMRVASARKRSVESKHKAPATISAALAAATPRPDDDEDEDAPIRVRRL